MANWSWTGPGAFGNEAAFRSWAGGLSAAFTAIGMHLVDSTSGTGGINWSSTAITTGLSPAFLSYAGSPSYREIAWEVWRFPTAGEGDGIHDTSPLYIRIGYGQAEVYYGQGLRATIGTAYTAGTGGVVTGIGGVELITLSRTGLSGLNSASTHTSWASCDGNGLAVGNAINTSAQRSFFVIDRHRLLDGTPSVAASGPNAGWSTGVAVYTTAPTSQIRAAHLDPIEDDGYTTTADRAPCVTRGGFVNTQTYRSITGQTEFYPWWSATKSGFWVSKMVTTYAIADLGAPGTEQPLFWLPTTTTRTMKLVGSLLDGAVYDVEGSPTGGLGLAMWWSD